MTILYFGIARDLAGVASEDLPFAVTPDTEALWSTIIARHPALAECRFACRLAADLEYIPTGASVPEGTREIAVIPPVAGG